MAIAATYEVHLADEDTGQTLSCLWVPMPEVRDVFGALDRELELEHAVDVPWPSDLSAALLAIQLGGDLRGAASLYQEMHRPEFWEEAGEEQMQPLLRFSEYAAYAPLIPVQQSPVELQSLSSLLAASGAGGGAMIGGAVAMGASPLLFLYTPIGIIVVAAAVAIGQGLHYHILRAMGVPMEGAAEATEAEEAT
jgi:hypothetical protein